MKSSDLFDLRLVKTSSIICIGNGSSGVLVSSTIVIETASSSGSGGGWTHWTICQAVAGCSFVCKIVQQSQVRLWLKASRKFFKSNKSFIFIGGWADLRTTPSSTTRVHCELFFRFFGWYWLTFPLWILWYYLDYAGQLCTLPLSALAMSPLPRAGVSSSFLTRVRVCFTASKSPVGPILFPVHRNGSLALMGEDDDFERRLLIVHYKCM